LSGFILATPLAAFAGGAAAASPDKSTLPSLREVCRIPDAYGMPVVGSLGVAGSGRYVVYGGRNKDPNGDAGPITWIVVDRKDGKARTLYDLQDWGIRQPRIIGSASIRFSGDPASLLVALVDQNRKTLRVYGLSPTKRLSVGVTWGQGTSDRIHGVCVLTDTIILTRGGGDFPPWTERWHVKTDLALSDTCRGPMFVSGKGVGRFGVVVAACEKGGTLVFVRRVSPQEEKTPKPSGERVDELLFVTGGRIVRKLTLKQLVGRPVVDEAGRYAAWVQGKTEGAREVVVQNTRTGAVSRIRASDVIGVTPKCVVVARRRPGRKKAGGSREIVVCTLAGDEIGALANASAASLSGQVLYYCDPLRKTVMEVDLGRLPAK